VRQSGGYASCSEILCERGNLDEYIFILKTILDYTDKGFTMSRRTLTELAREKYPYATEERMRKKTDDLQELKLITKSVGRVGMRLTLNGVKYINDYHQYPPIKA
jgi:hypothetical protein